MEFLEKIPVSKTSAILTQNTDRAYMVVQAVLGGLASVTVGGLAWAIWHSAENGALTAGAGRQPVPHVVSVAPAPAPTEIKPAPKAKSDPPPIPVSASKTPAP